jgi:hypothetical protein
MAIYIQYDSISGEAANSNQQKKWIEISSFQWGVGRGISSPSGGSADREGSTPSVGEIVVTKNPYSISNVRILNVLGPPQPSAGRQLPPNRPRAAEPVPPWLKDFLTRLRPLMTPTGKIHLGGFQFDARELSTLAGVQVRQLP